MFQRQTRLGVWITQGMLGSWLLLAIATLVSAGDFKVQQNLTYATVGEIRLQLDLAMPVEGSGPLPTIVFIHGGGWSGGNRHAFRGKVEEAAAKGYVAATISYRLTQPDPMTGAPLHPHPAQIHDCKAAIRWLKEHAAEYRIDPERMAVAGASAGGHLSLLVGLTDSKNGLEGVEGEPKTSSRVRAVVNIFGPVDLKHLYETSPGAVGFLKGLCDGTPQSAPQAYESASPIQYVSKDDPPVLTLHGMADKLVPPDQAQLLDAKMKEVGATHVLLLLEGQAHGFRGDASTRADDAAWEFLAAHLKAAP